MQVNFQFKDYRGKHEYHYEFKAAPRAGDYVQLLGEEYKILKVTWDNGLPVCKCRPEETK